MNPKISIILPVYNAERTLKETLDSIFNQTFKDFEILLINDGSNDGSGNIIASYTDSRIRLIDNGTNKGLIYSLNYGIEKVRGEYIARMDSDDIMAPDRLKIQYEYMQLHPDVDICGSFIEIFESSEVIGHQLYGTTNDEIKSELLFNSPLAHPTYFIRRSSFMGYKYSPNFKYCEDYELLSRFLLNNHKGANIPEYLLKYRISENSQTKIGESDSLERFLSISRTQNSVLKKGLGISNDEYHSKLHYSLSLSQRIENLDLREYPIREIKKYFNLLIKRNYNSNYCEHKALEMTLGKIWLKLLRYKIKGNFHRIGSLFFSRYMLYGFKYLKFRISY